MPAKIDEEPYSCDTFLIAPDFGSVRNTLVRVSAWLSDQNVQPENCDNVQLVLAEILNNIVEHGSLWASQEIKLTVSLTSENIDCRIRDLGRPIRVLLRKSNYGLPDETVTSELPEGGFGLFLVQSIARDIRYLPIKTGNHLALCVPLITDSEQIY
ncbi:MAG: ATP-binding protein [Paracoccaceae bacterium]|nr:ATP-binding protein [Paracoccaceae bacterium]